MNDEELNWIGALTGLNFLAIYDVLLDIHESSQMSDDVTIPVMRTIIRFRELFPADAINFRDRYSELRWNAVEFLKGKSIVHSVSFIRGTHRWFSNIRLRANKSVFNTILEKFHTEYEARTLRSGNNHIVITEEKHTPMDDLRRILSRFHYLAIQMRDRYDKRPTLDVSDEYDTQNFLHVLLRLFFDDIRPEEWTPSYAGKSSRVDFFLPKDEIVVEVKKTRSGLGPKELSDQLIIDIQRYKKLSGCKTLVCFIYDPENRITNPLSLQSDLSGVTDGLNVEVIINPRLL